MQPSHSQLCLHQQKADYSARNVDYKPDIASPAAITIEAVRPVVVSSSSLPANVHLAEGTQKQQQQQILKRNQTVLQRQGSFGRRVRSRKD
ncbi:unnamed protein product [Calypogeia fissa]